MINLESKMFVWKNSMTILSIEKVHYSTKLEYTLKQKKESDTKQDLIMIPFFSISMFSEYKQIQ